MAYSSDCLFLKLTMLCQTKQQNFSFLGLVAAILNWGHTHYNRLYTNPIKVYTAYNLCIATPQPEGPKKYLDKLHLHSMFLHNSLLKHCHTFLFYASYET